MSTEDDDSVTVEVPETRFPLSGDVFIPEDRFDPLCESESFGVDIYLELLDYVQCQLAL